MCLILLVHQPHPGYSLVVAANRDEVYDRPTEKVHFWTPSSTSSSSSSSTQTDVTILAGKDLKAGGTWMGTTKQGRFAAVTNFREPRRDQEEAAALGPSASRKSRGELVSDFLTCNLTAQEFLEGIQNDSSSYYDGFNLVVGDVSSGLYFYSNRGENSNGGSNIQGHLEKLESGRVYGLSNRFLDYPWPKLQRAKQQFSAILQKTIMKNTAPTKEPENILENECFAVLKDSTKVDDDLPTHETDCPAEFEKLASSIFIESDWYGTMASSVLVLRDASSPEEEDGGSQPQQYVCSFTERSFGPNGAFLGEVKEGWG